MKIDNIKFFQNDNNSIKQLSNDDFIKNWNSYSDGEKIDAVQSIAENYAAEIGLKNCPTFYIENRPDVYGSNFYRSNMITINLDACSNPYEALDTVIHEMNHAYQYQSIHSLDNSRYSEVELIYIKSQLGPDYISDGIGYDIQFVEADSNSTAFNYVKENVSEHNMIEYNEYLHDRHEYYKNIDDTISNDAQCTDILKNQLEGAFNNNKISNDELEVGKKNLDNSEYYNKFERELHQSKEAYINCSLKTSSVLHEKFIESQVSDDIEMESFNTSSQICIDGMLLGKEKIEEELNSQMKEQREYVNQKSLTILSARNDEKFQEYNDKINSLTNELNNYKYHITELETDKELLNAKDIKVEHIETKDSYTQDNTNEMGM